MTHPGSEHVEGSPSEAVATMRAYTDATRETMRVVSGSRRDEQPVFEAILEAARRLCGAPFAGLGLCNDERTHF